MYPPAAHRCVSEGCRRERLYMGRMATASPVLLRPGHRWANAGVPQFAS